MSVLPGQAGAQEIAPWCASVRECRLSITPVTRVRATVARKAIYAVHVRAIHVVAFAAEVTEQGNPKLDPDEHDAFTCARTGRPPRCSIGRSRRTHSTAVAARYASWLLCWEYVDRASRDVQSVDPVNVSTVVFASVSSMYIEGLV
jgi:hypothetical protein